MSIVWITCPTHVNFLLLISARRVPITRACSLVFTAFILYVNVNPIIFSSADHLTYTNYISSFLFFCYLASFGTIVEYWQGAFDNVIVPAKCMSFHPCSSHGLDVQSLLYLTSYTSSTFCKLFPSQTVSLLAFYISIII